MWKSFVIKTPGLCLTLMVLMPSACAGTDRKPEVQAPQALSQSKGDVILRTEAEQREDISRARTAVEALRLVETFKLQWHKLLNQPDAILQPADRRQVEEVILDLDAVMIALEKLSRDFPEVRSTDRRAWTSSLRSEFSSATSARATKGTKP